jgi:hypothetical protein
VIAVFQVSESDKKAINKMLAGVIQTSDSTEDRLAAIKAIGLIDSLEPESRTEAFIIRILLMMRKADREAHQSLGVGILVIICAIAALVAVLQ